MKIFLIPLILLICLINRDGNSQDIWEPTNGPNVYDIVAVVITSDSVMVVSLKNDGIYFSKDKGVSWIKKQEGLFLKNSYASSLAAGTNGIVYAVVRDELYSIESNSNLWIKSKHYFGGSIKVYANENGYLYIIRNFFPGLFLVSVDRGKTFYSLSHIQSFDGVGSFVLGNSENNFLQLYDRFQVSYLFRINDGGGDFYNIPVAGLTNLLMWHNSGYLFFIHRSSNTLIITDRNGMILFENKSMPFTINKLAIKPNGNILAFTNEGDYESSDFGWSWVKNTSQLFRSINYYSNIFFLGGEVYIFNIMYDLNASCSSGFVRKTSDEGVTWSTLDIHSSNSKAQQIIVDKASRLFANTCQDGAYSYSLDKGKTWGMLRLPYDRPSIDLVSTTSGNLFLLMDLKLYKSTDYGRSWKEDNLSTNRQFHALKGDHGNIIYLISYNNDSFVSKDGGLNWSLIKLPSVFPIHYMYFHSDGTVYAVVFNHVLNEEYIYFSDNDGSSWILRDLKPGMISSMCTTMNGMAFIGTTGGDIYSSSNKFLTAEKISSNGGVGELLAADNKGNLYAVASSEFRRSKDNGHTWTFFGNDGLPSTEYNFMAIDNQNYLYLSFKNDAIYKTINPVSGRYETDKERLPSDDDMFKSGTDEIQFIINKIPETPMNWRMVSIDGRVVKYGKFRDNINDIDLSDIDNGVYFLISEDSKFPMKKIVVQH